MNTRRKPAAKKPPVAQPAPQATPEETPAQDLVFTQDETPQAGSEWTEVATPLAFVEPEPEAPEHVRTLARKVRQHANTPHVHFDAAQNVTLMFGYSGLSHVVHGHPHTHIATHAELSAMNDQQVYDAVMRHSPPRERQGYPMGGQR